jgi:hypothetical protein
MGLVAVAKRDENGPVNQIVPSFFPRVGQTSRFLTLEEECMGHCAPSFPAVETWRIEEVG